MKFIIIATSRDCVFNTSWSGAFLMSFYYYLDDFIPSDQKEERVTFLSL